MYSSKEKINKVSAKKAKAQSKANNILYKDILANLNKSTEGLLKTSFGVKKSDIYKEEIFSELVKRLAAAYFSICFS